MESRSQKIRGAKLRTLTLFIGLPLISYVSHNCFLASILTYGVRIVPTRPQRTAPQYLFYFRMPPEDFLRCDTLDDRNQPSYGHSRNTLYKKMNMIFFHPYFNESDLIPFSDSKANIPKAFFHTFTENLTSIFGRKHQMIQEQCFVVALIDMLAHLFKLPDVHPNCAPEGRGIRPSFD